MLLSMELAAAFITGGIVGVVGMIFACRWAYKPEQGDGKTIYHRGTVHPTR